MMHTELAHANDPDTSHMAAAALKEEELSQVKAAILYLLSVRAHTVPELTKLYFSQREISGWPDVKPDSIAKRCSDLVNAKLVTDTGRRIPGPYKRPIAVWAVAE